MTTFGTRRVWMAVIALAFAIAGCGGGEENAGGGGGGGQGKPIKIGVNVGVSGPAAVLGEAYANAARLRAKQINQDGGIMGRRVELLVRDNKSDQTEALTITRELDREGAAAMLGPGTTPTTLAAMAAIQQAGFPTISMGSAGAIVQPPQEKKNVFKTPPDGDVVAEALVADMKRRGIKSAALLSVNNPYGDDGLQAMRKATEAGDVKLVATEKFEENDSDVTPQLRRLQRANAEAIVVWAIPPGAPTVRRNAVERLNIDTPMYFDTGAGAELFLELAGESANGALVAQPQSLVWDQVPENAPLKEELTRFGEAYTEEVGEMSGFAGYSWDALGLVKAAMEKAKSTEPEAVNKAIEELGVYNGVSGTLEYSDQKHSGMGADDLVILEVEDGEWKLPDESKQAIEE